MVATEPKLLAKVFPRIEMWEDIYIEELQMNPRKVPNTTEQASSTESLAVRPTANAKAERSYERMEGGKQPFEKATPVELECGPPDCHTKGLLSCPATDEAD